MVNVPGRSKGCIQCRQRKRKCDEVSPICQQCLSKGLQCSGPRTSAVFFHVLPAPSSRSLTRSVVPKHSDVSSPVTLAPIHLNQPDMTCKQPDKADIFDSLFVSHFIESFGFKSATVASQPPTWLDELSAMVTSPGDSLTKYSIRAASMYFYGILAQDASIQTEACKWYSRSLQGLRVLLSHKSPELTERIICATVMLTHYENIAGTYRGWLQHVQGAAIMLETRSPQSCRDGFLHQIFRHLRLLTVSSECVSADCPSRSEIFTQAYLLICQFVSAMFKNEQHAFASSVWKTIPFEIYPKSLFDRFVDILFSLLPCLSIAEKVIRSPPGNGVRLDAELSTAISRSMSQLHEWWMHCVSIPTLLEADAVQGYNTGNTSTEHQYSDPGHFPLIPYSDMPTAALVSIYDAANVVLLQLLYLVSSDAHLYEERTQRHIHSIRSAREFIAAIPGPVSGRGLLMVEFPLQILDVWSRKTEITPKESSYPGLSARNYGSVDCSSELFGHAASYIHRIQVDMTKTGI